MKEFRYGEYYEQMPWELHVPYESSIYDSEEVTAPCAHLVWTGAAETKRRPDGSIYGYERPYRLQAAVKCYNEAGCNATVLCLQCLDEARATYPTPVAT